MQLTLKYRPRKFSEVFGQHVEVQILRNAVAAKRISKGYLISGLYGVGKTTLARIFAKALNCSDFQGDVCCVCKSCIDAQRGGHPSIIEMDAASNNGVDNIRSLEELTLQKSLYPYRVIILDEAHMLTTQAQAAFLKILEDTRPHNIFILVTTDPLNLNPMIRSRCLSIPLRSMLPQDIGANLRNILQVEGISYEEPFIDALSNLTPSLREAQQILDRALAVGPLTLEALSELCGTISSKVYEDLASVLISKDIRYSLEMVEHWYYSGVDLVQLYKEGIPNLLRDFLVHLSGASTVYYQSGLDKQGLDKNLTLKVDEVKMISKEWENSYVPMVQGINPKVLLQTFFARCYS